MLIKYAMSYKHIIFFILLCNNIFSEILPNMILLISSEEKITQDYSQSKIVRFQQKNNAYHFFKIIHDFEKGRNLDRLKLLPQKKFIIYENDKNDKIFIIDTKNIKEIIKLDWAMRTTTNSTHKEELIQYNVNINGNSEVFSFHTSNQKKRNIVNSRWRESLHNNCFYVKDAIRYCGMGMNHEIFLPVPNESFLSEGENLDCVVEKKLSELKEDKIRYMVKSSQGENFIYFFWNKNNKVINLIWIYNIKEKKWSWNKLNIDNVEVYDFEDNFAVKHGYFLERDINKTEVFYNGNWTIYLSGEKKDILLEQNSKILYLTSDKMIYSDMNRLYEVPIINRNIKLKQRKLIAEDDIIRNSNGLFFEENKK